MTLWHDSSTPSRPRPPTLPVRPSSTPPSGHLLRPAGQHVACHLVHATVGGYTAGLLAFFDRLPPAAWSASISTSPEALAMTPTGTSAPTCLFISGSKTGRHLRASPQQSANNGDSRHLLLTTTNGTLTSGKHDTALAVDDVRRTAVKRKTPVSAAPHHLERKRFVAPTAPPAHRRPGCPPVHDGRRRRRPRRVSRLAKYPRRLKAMPQTHGMKDATPPPALKRQAIIDGDAPAACPGAYRLGPPGFHPPTVLRNVVSGTLSHQVHASMYCRTS